MAGSRQHSLAANERAEGREEGDTVDIVEHVAKIIEDTRAQESPGAAVIKTDTLELLHLYATRLRGELQDAREVLQFADGAAVEGMGRGLADLYAEDCHWAQNALKAAGCWPRGSDHTTPTAGRGSPVADGW